MLRFVARLRGYLLHQQGRSGITRAGDKRIL
jgi:hypothetical protein